jgi:serine/threonine-protein kinase RsbW
VATIQLSVPATPEFVGLIRSAASHAAAHADLTVEQIDDLRLAVDEAYALLVQVVADERDIHVTFDVEPGHIKIDFHSADAAAPISQDGFAWTVLQALVPHIDLTHTDNALTLSLEMLTVASA